MGALNRRPQHRHRRHRRTQSGAVAVVVGFLSVALFVLCALVVDLGNARDVRRQAQAGADASALAAANELYINGGIVPRITQAVSAAKAYAAANYGVTPTQWAGCSDPYALPYRPDATPCISFDQSAQPTTVRVKLPAKRVGTPFGSLIGVRSVSVAAKAHASLTLHQKVGCGLCVVGGGLHDLQNGNATVSGGNIDFNGSVNVNSNGLIATDGNILVQGTASGPYTNYDPDPLTGQPGIVDPLKRLALPPDMSTLTVKSTDSNGCPTGPGKYGGVNLPSATCTLSPGLYVIAGPSGTEWKLNGTASQVLAGDGVTLYFTCGTPATPTACASGATGADLDASGNGQLAIKAPTTGPLAGLALVYDRNNHATFRLTGNGASSLTGTIYMPSGTLQMNGNGCSTTQALLVVGDLTMNGTGACLKSSYDSNQNVSPAPTDMHLTQ